MLQEILAYNDSQLPDDKAICNLLANTIQKGLKKADCKIWHAHPVWFIAGNPIAGYSKQKAGWRLMFWSGASFEEPGLPVVGKKFKDASVFYKSADEINVKDLKRWLQKSMAIQWDYKNIIQRKGQLLRLH